MTAIEKVVEIAKDEIGYVEKASNSQLNDKTANPGSNNWTKYGAYFDVMRGTYEFYNGPKNGYDWCDQFTDWCFCQAFDMDTARKMLYQPMSSCGAGCKFSASYYKQNNAWLSAGQKPNPGDQIFFGPKGDETHTGLVVDANDTKVWTVEGNAANRVMRRVYELNDSYIAGYGRPNWSLVAQNDYVEPTNDDVETCTVTLPVLRQGAKGGYVETLQVLLKHYFNSSIAVDGDFGPQTDMNVKEYQRKHNVAVDGIVGPITWGLLLK